MIIQGELIDENKYTNVSYFELQLFAQTKDVQIFGLHAIHY